MGQSESLHNMREEEAACHKCSVWSARGVLELWSIPAILSSASALRSILGAVGFTSHAALNPGRTGRSSVRLGG